MRIYQTPFTGANLAAEDRLGKQPAHLAACRNHRKVLEFLYNQGVQLDQACDAGRLPVHYAAQHGGLFIFNIIVVSLSLHMQGGFCLIVGKLFMKLS